MGERDHFVQFAESDDFLIHSVSGFIGSALARGDAGIVVVTPAHRAALDEALIALGLDVAALTAAGRYLALDAEETLARICVAGWPDDHLFHHVVGPVVEKMGKDGRRVRAFGEMVSLLMASGERKSAVRLEELWNEAMKLHRFSLFCSYRVSGEIDQATLNAVCRQHSNVIPGESYATLESPNDRLRAVVELQQRVAALEADAQKRSGVDRSFLRRLRHVD